MTREHRVLGLTILLTMTGCAQRAVIVAEPTPRVVAAPGPAATLGIPPGHFPRVGECRVWLHGLPPGKQPRPKSRSCTGIAAAAPAGSWILYRPLADRRLVHVRIVDERRPGTVVKVRIFEAANGRFLREENP